jgi:predicted amidohydrolase
MRTPFTICLAQLAPRLGDVAANVELHEDAIARAREQNARLVVFPELSLTGYRLRDLTFDVALPAGSPLLARIGEKTRGGPDVLVGFVEESADHRFYNAAAYWSEGRLLALHRKVYLPTYGMFDEGAFAAGERSGLRQAGRSHLICEDVTCPRPTTSCRTSTSCWWSAAPGRGPSEARFRQDLECLLIALANFFNCYTVTSTASAEDGVKFWGGSRSSIRSATSRQAARSSRAASPTSRRPAPGADHAGPATSGRRSRHLLLNASSAVATDAPLEPQPWLSTSWSTSSARRRASSASSGAGLSRIAWRSARRWWRARWARTALAVCMPGLGGRPAQRRQLVAGRSGRTRRRHQRAVRCAAALNAAATRSAPRPKSRCA